MIPSAHQPALFFTQAGTPSADSEDTVVGGIWIIPSAIKNEIPVRNSDSEMSPSAHQPALFFTHSGTSAYA